MNLKIRSKLHSISMKDAKNLHEELEKLFGKTLPEVSEPFLTEAEKEDMRWVCCDCKAQVTTLFSNGESRRCGACWQRLVTPLKITHRDLSSKTQNDFASVAINSLDP